MRLLKVSLVIAASILVTFGLSGMSFAFHNGGVATCDSCHSMHNSFGNVAMDNNISTKFTGNPYLLKYVDQSSTCLSCHARSTQGSFRVMTYPAPSAVGATPVQYTPGGDFGWLTKTDLGSGATSKSMHGHNIVAQTFGLVADTRLANAPGPGATGAYSADKLNCISCHDPHPSARIIDGNGTIAYRAGGTAVLPIGASGSAFDNVDALPGGSAGINFAEEALGVYRILAGKTYKPASYAGGPAFVNDPPSAVAPRTYNQKENTTNGEARVAYGAGMSEWCANCHGAIHNTTSSVFIHQAGVALGGATSMVNYNQYKKSGDLTGTSDLSYTSMVPLERGTKVIATLFGYADNTTNYLSASTNNSSKGADANSKIMCLSCHRAHASGFRAMERWNNNSELIAVEGAWPGTDAASAEGRAVADGKTQAEYQAAMYDRPATVYAFSQRSLCNKCHAKD
jgi:hypothetical protein